MVDCGCWIVVVCGYSCVVVCGSSCVVDSGCWFVVVCGFSCIVVCGFSCVVDCGCCFVVDPVVCGFGIDVVDNLDKQLSSLGLQSIFGFMTVVAVVRFVCLFSVVDVGIDVVGYAGVWIIVVDTVLLMVDFTTVGVLVVVVVVVLAGVWMIVVDVGMDVIDSTDVGISVVVVVVELVRMWSIVANEAVGVVDLGLDVVDLTGMTTTLQSSLLDDG